MHEDICGVYITFTVQQAQNRHGSVNAVTEESPLSNSLLDTHFDSSTISIVDQLSEDLFSRSLN